MLVVLDLDEWILALGLDCPGTLEVVPWRWSMKGELPELQACLGLAGLETKLVKGKLVTSPGPGIDKIS